jgi:phosphoenolpyruvate carboxykinase (GTP)
VTSFPELQAWVDQVTALTRPDTVHWCDGSTEEYRRLIGLQLASGSLIELNQQTHPGCYLHRSDPSDVARVEHLTFVCTEREEDAGPNNNWMDPSEARSLMERNFSGCMQGRTLYVIPYCMGPVDSPLARCGVEITDSPYVVVNMYLMTRMGDAALRRIERERTFIRGLHSTGTLDPENRWIMHFPEDLEIQSYGSGYGGNALLGKKCHALRIASYQARSEGWLAEHMLIVGIENPAGEVHYIAAAFPSACGKTNLAMLIPPDSFPGWKVWTIGDDICWMRLGEDGRLWAINPEAGFFGVAPGTSSRTNPNALSMLNRDTIFTNVGVTADNQPWWEGIGYGEPVTDWRGQPYDASRGPAAHPNSRFTVSISRCPSYTPASESAQGVPLSAIVFGGRRQRLVPLVFESESWQHGVLVGAAMASETTAAATGEVGAVRRDPMAMLPFCGYNFGDYWAHWLGFGAKSDKLPKIFHVNWFHKDREGRFMWPGYGENLRVLDWIMRRCSNQATAVKTPIGLMPHAADIELDGLDIAPETMAALLEVRREAWHGELAEIIHYFHRYGKRTPAALIEECHRIIAALEQE